MEEDFPIDWGDFEMAEDDMMMNLLSDVPRERWSDAARYSKCTLLHIACHNGAAKSVCTLLHNPIVDVNARTRGGGTPMHWAVKEMGRPLQFHQQRRIIEMLCVAGAELRVFNHQGDSPLDCALTSEKTEDLATVLVANGLRLSNVMRTNRIKPKLEAFERGVLKCRATVVAMLRVKHVGQLWKWDKFLLREIAFAVWATRYEKEWQN